MSISWYAAVLAFVFAIAVTAITVRVKVDSSGEVEVAKPRIFNVAPILASRSNVPNGV